MIHIRGEHIRRSKGSSLRSKNTAKIDMILPNSLEVFASIATVTDRLSTLVMSALAQRVLYHRIINFDVQSMAL